MSSPNSLPPGSVDTPSSRRAEARGGVLIEGLTCSYGAVKALDSVQLQIHPGEYFCLLGPSGCGKTTLLRSIAGLETPEAGRILVDGVDLAITPANERPVNTVFQSYALFPHLRVEDNVAFGLRMRKRPTSEVRERVERMMRLTRVDGLSRRYPHELSGGQRQRVALARAMVNEPHVLLLDEPLGALDLQLRRELQAELKSFQRQLGTTFVHVTHDQEEAMALSDRLAVLRGGRVCQVGTPSELYGQPVSSFVAAFLGACNLVEARIESGAQGRFWAASPLGRIPLLTANPGAIPGAQIRVGMRPEHLRVLLEKAQGSDDHLHCFPAQITNAVFSGAWVLVELHSGGAVLTAMVPSSAPGVRDLRAGVGVWVQVSAEHCLCFPND